MSSRLRLRTIAVAAVALGLVAGSATVASATEDGATEDSRARAHDGNVTKCEQIGLGGGILVSYGDDKPVENISGIVYQDGRPNNDRYLTITELPDDLTVTAIVVKGGPRYNVYVPGENGLSATPPWENLRAPLNPGGNIPTISHWFACGTEAPDEERPDPSQTPSSEQEKPSDGPGTSEPDTPGEPSKPGEPTDGTETTATEPETSVTTSTSSSGAAVPGPSETEVSPAGENDDLASTGFSGGWLIGLGAALLLGGGALLALARIRRGKA